MPRLITELNLDASRYWRPDPIAHTARRRRRAHVQFPGALLQEPEALGCGAIGRAGRGVLEGHLVAEAADSHDCWRRHRTRAQLDPQAADVHVNRASAAGVLIPPDQRREVIARQNL